MYQRQHLSMLAVSFKTQQSATEITATEPSLWPYRFAYAIVCI